MNKMVLLNCLAVFVFFNVCVLLISCAKKKADEIREADASPSKPATEVPVKPTKFTPQMVVEAIEHVAQKLPAAEREDFLQDSPLLELYRTTDDINEAMVEGEN